MRTRSVTSFLSLLILAASLLGLSEIAVAATGTTTTGVNMRTSPQGRVLFTIAPNQKVEVLSRSGNWYKIKAGRQTGYVFAKYLKTGRIAREANTEANCEDCAIAARAQRTNNTEDIQRVLDLVNVEPASNAAECMTREMIKAAKWIHQNRYGGREKGRGKCGYAVRYGLERAGFYGGGGIGNAKDMMPGLKRMGFKNIMTKGMTPSNAPNGTILVYGKARVKGCRGLGSTYGHIEVKENNNSFLYDGNPAYNIQEAFGKNCRPLIGVMQATGNCPTCKAKMKRACGV